MITTLAKATFWWGFIVAWETIALELISEPGISEAWQLGAAIGLFILPAVLFFTALIYKEENA